MSFDYFKNCYAFKYPNGKYAGIDQTYGGRPFETNLPGNVKFWYDLEEALLYNKMFPELTLYKVTIISEKV